MPKRILHHFQSIKNTNFLSYDALEKLSGEYIWFIEVGEISNRNIFIEFSENYLRKCKKEDESGVKRANLTIKYSMVGSSNF